MDNKIKEIRLSKNMTQTELAIRSGISLVQLQYLEQGRRDLTLGSVKQLYKIACALGVDPDDLIDWPYYYEREKYRDADK